MNSILVTGGAGFIGSHLVSSLLARSHSVRVLDNLSSQVHGALPCGLEWLLASNVEFFRGSVTNRAHLLRALDGVTQIVHLAAETGTGQSMYEVARYNEVNSQGTALLLDVLANAPGHQVRRIVLASSRSVYGEGAYVCKACDRATERFSRLFPAGRSAAQLASRVWEPLCSRCSQPLTAIATRESDTLRPASIYATTKFAQEELLRVGCASLGISLTVLRLQNVYGEGQSLKNPYTGILSIFSTRLRRGLPLSIFEDGLESRDFVHVSDVVAAILSSLAASTAYDIVNVGSGIATSVLDVARQLAIAFCVDNAEIRITGDYRLGDIRHNVADIGALKASLGLQPTVTLGEGLDRFARWVLTQALPEDQLEKANAELRSRKLMG